MRLSVNWGIPLLLLISGTATALQEMTEQQMQEVTGQALFYTNYTAPNTASTATNFGFYRVGIEAEMNLNANIRSLKLGCDAANVCDIDIDYLSLSGQASSADARAASDALIRNPFFEVAIRNPQSASTREIAGVRFSAAHVNGLLTAGTENSNTPNGINRISGYMKIQSDSSGTIKGLASTAAARDNLFGGNQVTGRLQALGLGGAAEVQFKTVGGGFNIPQINNNPFSTPAIIVNGSRISSVNLISQVAVPTITLNPNNTTAGVVTYDVNGNPTGVATRGGPVVAEVTSCSWFACFVAQSGDRFNNVQLLGSISNIRANLNLSQSLGMIHNLPISSPASLSLQKEAVQWPGAVAADIAQKGWWLSLSDPVNIGNVVPSNLIDINPLFPQISAAVSTYLASNPAKTSDLDGLLFGAQLDVNIGTVDLINSPLSLPLSNLKLANQDFAVNCYAGAGLSFC